MADILPLNPSEQNTADILRIVRVQIEEYVDRKNKSLATSLGGTNGKLAELQQKINLLEARYDRLESWFNEHRKAGNREHEV